MLANLIQQHAVELAAAGKWDAVAAVLAAKTIERKTSGLTTFREFVSLFGFDSAEAVLVGWSTSEVGKSLRTRLEVVGLDFSDAQTIELIDKLDAQSKWQTGIASTLKEIGTRMISPAESEGLADPTAEECEAAVAGAKFQQDWATVQNDLINPVVNDREALIAGLRAAADRLEVK